MALFSSNDPLLESMTELLSVLEARLQSGEGLEALEKWLGEFFGSLEEMPYVGLRFEL